MSARSLVAAFTCAVVLATGSSTFAAPPDHAISLDLRNAEVVDVLRLLALESQRNIVIDHSVHTSRATIHLQNVSFDTALRVVSEAYDLQVHEEGSVLIVSSSTTDILGPKTTVAFPLRFSTAAEAAAQLNGIVPKDAVRADERRNSVLITGDAGTIKTATTYLRALDRISPQVMFEVKVVDVTLANDASNVGVLFGGPASVGSTTYTFTNRSIPIQATLDALISENRAQVLATPRVASMNNREANLRIGTSYPIVTTTTTGTTTSQNVDYLNIGVNLRLTPIIGDNGSITTEIHPQYSVLQGLSAQGYPITANRQVDSTLRVQSDETIVLGGMFSDITSETVTKVPLLSSIPILGEAFKNRQKTHQRDDVVFLITPHLL
ncbi:MAG TPA: secretin N-terminal domain-containing protein [Candidatus Baltobacteraceae bacterium]|nr:secretin N-terminal domain-containing protein [Candidatus Baltobacteraceae bacterium]